MKKPRERIPQTQVLEWLEKNHPDLHKSAEPERAWVWVSTDLRGENNKPVRESIKDFGFRFAKRGHTLPSGKVAFWGHAGEKPTPFKRHGKDGGRAGFVAREQNGAIDDGLASEIDSALREMGVA